MISLPSWLKRDSLKLPHWAKVEKHPYSKSGKVSLCIKVSTKGYVEDWLKLLEVKKVNQYWLEVAYQCAKLELQSCLVGTEYDPTTSGKPVEFHFDNAPEYALKKFPKGRGIEVASKGLEAREHYKRLRGHMPF